MGAPYIYDISHLRVKLDHLQKLPLYEASIKHNDILHKTQRTRGKFTLPFTKKLAIVRKTGDVIA